MTPKERHALADALVERADRIDLDIMERAIPIAPRAEEWSLTLRRAALALREGAHPVTLGEFTIEPTDEALSGESDDAVFIECSAAEAARYVGALSATDRLRAEVTELSGWKASAMTELGRWDAVYEALGRPGRLGESKADACRDEALRLRQAMAVLVPFAKWADWYLEDGCRRDHHGKCQSHGLDEDCPVGPMREWLARLLSGATEGDER